MLRKFAPVRLPSWPVLQVQLKIMRRFWGGGAIGAYGGGAQYFGDDGLCRPAGTLAFWYRQLWAESLGKEGKGSVPVNALGPVDQHSQMQLYMAGPDDKFYTLLSHQTRGGGTGVPDSFADDDGLASLAGHTMGNLVDAEARGTMDTLAEAGRPLRHMALGQH